MFGKTISTKVDHTAVYKKTGRSGPSLHAHAHTHARERRLRNPLYRQMSLNGSGDIAV
jgi:hypothetical protein